MTSGIIVGVSLRGHPNVADTQITSDKKRADEATGRLRTDSLCVICFTRLSRDRQVNRESATRTRRALHTYSSAVRFHNLFHQTKPDSAALNLRGDRFMATVKRLEDVSKICRADP